MKRIEAVKNLSLPILKLNKMLLHATIYFLLQACTAKLDEKKVYTVGEVLKFRELLLDKQITIKGHFDYVTSFQLFESLESYDSGDLEQSISLSFTTDFAQFVDLTCFKQDIKVTGVLNIEPEFQILNFKAPLELLDSNGSLCHQE